MPENSNIIAKKLLPHFASLLARIIKQKGSGVESGKENGSTVSRAAGGARVVSKLADGSILCGWEYYANRDGHKVIGITPHYMAAHWTGKECARYFQNNGISNSANYCIGYNGDLWCNVEEQNAAWTSSSYSNDCTHITIEIGGNADNATIIPEAALEKFKQLATDIALRYGIKAYEYTGKAGANFTIHKIFAATPCPGWYFEQKIPELIKDINARIKAGDPTGLKQGWKKESDKWYYYMNGQKVKGQWLKDKGKWYYLDAGTGIMRTGWVSVDGKIYYCAKNGVMQTGFQTIGSKLYYFKTGDSGRMLTGWFTVDGKKHYANEAGVVQTGWLTIKKKKYYFKPSANGAMVTGWYKGKEMWRYFKPTGVYSKAISAKYHPYEATVSVSELNIRKNAGVNYVEVGTLKKGKKVVIVKTKKGKDSLIWGLLADYFEGKDGWIATDYTKKK